MPLWNGPRRSVRFLGDPSSLTVHAAPAAPPATTPLALPRRSPPLTLSLSPLAAHPEPVEGVRCSPERIPPGPRAHKKSPTPGSGGPGSRALWSRGISGRVAPSLLPVPPGARRPRRPWPRRCRRSMALSRRCAYPLRIRINVLVRRVKRGLPTRSGERRRNGHPHGHCPLTCPPGSNML